MDLNRATIIGNVTRDIESRTTPSGQTVANFGIATNQVWNDAAGVRQERTEFHNIVAWGKLAEICTQYLGKGRKVYIEGRLQSREWEAQDGTKRNRTEIVAENMIMLDRAPGGPSAGPRPMEPTPPTEQSVSSGVSTQSPPTPAASDEIRVEDIPF